MGKLTPYVMAAVFVFISYLLLKLALKLNAHATKKKILSYGRPSEEAATMFFRAQLGEGNVLENRWLECKDSAGQKMYTEIDDIIVTRGGIFCVEVKSLVGMITSDNDTVWHQSVRTRSGEMKELDFRNPILQNSRHTEAVKLLLSCKGIPLPPVYNIVIFTSEKVAFSTPRKEIYTLKGGTERMRRLSSKKLLSKKARREIIRTINKNSAKPAVARAYNKKHFGS